MMSDLENMDVMLGVSSRNELEKNHEDKNLEADHESNGLQVVGRWTHGPLLNFYLHGFSLIHSLN